VPRTQVFISYSHANLEWLKRLRDHLKPLEREGKLDCWDDTHIKTGEDWPEAIEDALARAKVAVLLVSAKFLASDFIHEEELPPLLAAADKEGTVIMSLIVNACHFEESPLAEFQAHNAPELTLEDMEPRQARRELMEFSKSIRDAFSIADAPARAAKG
jgi:hypothetical protein